jgi:hypothetical protein
MRLTVEDLYGNDPEKVALCKRAEIYCNDVRQPGCVEADEEGGYVVVYIPQEDPEFDKARYEQGPDSWPKRRIEGVVRIVDPDA